MHVYAMEHVDQVFKCNKDFGQTFFDGAHCPARHKSESSPSRPRPYG